MIPFRPYRPVTVTPISATNAKGGFQWGFWKEQEGKRRAFGRNPMKQQGCGDWFGLACSPVFVFLRLSSKI